MTEDDLLDFLTTTKSKFLSQISKIPISLSRSGTQQLDGKYTVFGKVIGGLETVQKIGQTPTLVNRMGERSQPATPVYIERVVMIKR